MAIMFIIERPDDVEDWCDPADKANDTSVRKIIDFESARAALVQEQQGDDRLRALDRSSRTLRDYWLELWLTVVISFGVMVCWLLVIVWLCRF
jgi:hypothetical protein